MKCLIFSLINFVKIDQALAATFWSKKCKDSISYQEYFSAFTQSSALEKAVKLAKKDKYYCIFFNDAMAGIFFLRGLDSGYSRPSFGVYILQQFCRRGLASAAVSKAIQHCNELGVKHLMLKVSAENHVASSLYKKFGFQVEGTCEQTLHVMMNLDMQ